MTAAASTDSSLTPKAFHLLHAKHLISSLPYLTLPTNLHRAS